MEQLPRPIPWVGGLESQEILFLHCSPLSSELAGLPKWDSLLWPKSEILSFDYGEYLKANVNQSQEDLLAESHYLSAKSKRGNGYSRDLKSIIRFADEMSNVIFKNEREDLFLGLRFAVVNLVRCPSHSKKAILRAADFCSKTWLLPTLIASKAKIVFVLGQKPAQVICNTFPEQVPQNWGSFRTDSRRHGQGFWPRTKGDLQERLNSGRWKTQDQLENTFKLNLGDKSLLMVFHSTPGAGALWSTRLHTNLLSEEVVAYWRDFLLRQD